MTVNISSFIPNQLNTATKLTDTLKVTESFMTSKH